MPNVIATIIQVGIDLTTAFKDAINTSLQNLAQKDVDNYNELDGRISNIVAGAGSSNTEIVDARSSAVKSTTFPTLDARLEAAEQVTATHLADSTAHGIGTHKSNKMFHIAGATRDLSVAGSQAITGFGFSPKKVFIKAYVDGVSGKYSEGWVVAGVGATCLASLRNTGTEEAYRQYIGAIVNILDSAANSSSAVVASIDADGLTLTWSKGGSGATGTVTLIIIAESHY
jgi:hypothetical protein